MNHKKSITNLAFLLLGLGGLYAQESPTATGGEATGTGGTVSYSVGQLVYTTNTGTNGSVAHGVQQPFEISTTIGINEASINLELSVYPNPTTSYLTLKVDDFELSRLNFQLMDIQGKIIENQTINSNATHISLEGQAPATYFLNIVKDSQIVKSFKIVKQ